MFVKVPQVRGGRTASATGQDLKPPENAEIFRRGANARAASLRVPNHSPVRHKASQRSPRCDLVRLGAAVRVAEHSIRARVSVSERNQRPRADSLVEAGTPQQVQAHANAASVPLVSLEHRSCQLACRSRAFVGRACPAKTLSRVEASRRSTLPPSVLDASVHAQAPEPGSSPPCKVAR